MTPCHPEPRVDAGDRRAPRTVASAAEAGPLSFHIRRPAIAEFDRALCECDIFEMPTPTRVGLRAGDNSAHRDTRGAASLCGPRRGDCSWPVNKTRKRSSTTENVMITLDDGPVGEPSHPAHIVAKATAVRSVARFTRDLRSTISSVGFARTRRSRTRGRVHARRPRITSGCDSRGAGPAKKPSQTEEPQLM